MEKGEKKNIIVVKGLIILLFLILLFLIYLSVRNIYNNATFYLNGEKTMNLDLNANYEEDILEYRNDIIGHYRIS